MINIAAHQHSQDRVGYVPTSFGLCLLLADGAGGTSGGAQAAELFISRMSEVARVCRDVRELIAAFRSLDTELEVHPEAGETTGIVVVVSDSELTGASVGDSEAWFLAEQSVVKLTLEQERKPLLGSGRSAPTVFAVPRTLGLLLLASDGLFKYTSEQKILSTVRQGASEATLKQCVDLVRLRSGNLQDDLAIALLDV